MLKVKIYNYAGTCILKTNVEFKNKNKNILHWKHGVDIKFPWVRSTLYNFLQVVMIGIIVIP